MEGDKIMLLIYDTINNKIVDNFGTNANYPDGNIPGLKRLPEGQMYVRVRDGSAVAQTITEANEYELTLDDDGEITQINVLKTKAEGQAEIRETKEYKLQEIQRELKELDIEIPRVVEDIIDQGNFIIHQKKQNIIARKNQLRVMMQTLNE